MALQGPRDASVAFVAGFVVIPAAFAFGTDMQAGPRLVFEVMTGVFAVLPGGRIMGIFFFIALLMAVVSSLFTFFEIPMRVCEQKLGMGRKKGVLVVALIILVGNIIVSLGFGPLSSVTIPWPYATGIEQYGFYDWLDCFTAYLLLPAGVVLECIFVAKVWGFAKYDHELTNQGELTPIKGIEKFIIMVVNPILMIIVIIAFDLVHGSTTRWYTVPQSAGTCQCGLRECNEGRRCVPRILRDA